VDSRSIAFMVDLSEVNADSLADGLRFVRNYFIDFSVLVHEIASLSEFALLLLEKDLALPGSV
jgi:hypothetical protein